MDRTEESLTDASLRKFTDRLAAKQPVPGGGGAAALAGALSAALGSMAGNYTVGKKKYAAAEPEVIGILRELEQLRERLLESVDQDAAAFEPLSAAYAIPREDPGRAEVLEKALLTAAEPPLGMMKCCSRTIELLERLEEIGSRLMISDVGCGALLAGAALRSASLNVFINTSMMKNPVKAGEIEKEAERMLGEYPGRAAALADRVEVSIRRKKQGSE